jgi:excisionase family DNA binding protein
VNTQQNHQGKRIAYSIDEVASALGVHPATVRLEIARGKLKATRLARRVLIRASELERYLTANESAAGADADAR